MNESDHKKRQQDNVNNYRKAHKRFDYYPSRDALAVIEQNSALSNCVAGVIDALILNYFRK